MIIEKGTKVHVVYRALYENSTRRHFLGEVLEAEGALCRLQGYAFVYSPNSAKYIRKPEQRVTILDLAESGYIVNFVDAAVDLERVHYKYLSESGLIATDDDKFKLDINEFGAKS